MRTVYLDKNIYSYIYARQKGDLFDQILTALKKSSDFLVVYSYAHIEDILQSKDETKNFENLALIESIAEKNYCYYDNDLKKFCFGYYSPKEIYDCQEDIMPIIDSLFDKIDIESFLSDEMKNSLNKMKDEWISSNMPDKVDNPSLKLVGSFFPINLHELSIDEIFKESYRGIRAFGTNNSVYRSLRANNYNNFNKGQYQIDESNYTLTKDLTESPFEKSLLEITYSTLEQRKKEGEEVFRNEFHTTAYILLDLFGFNRDPKVKTNNLFVDSNHSYYGAHFDYVVSNDNGFVTKSRVLYNLLGINTKVLYPAEFLDEVNFLNKTQVDKKEGLWNRITFDSMNTQIAHQYEQFNKTICQYTSTSNFLHYFDTLVKITDTEKKDEFILLKSVNKYLENRIPVKIIAQLIEKCLSIFGEDAEGKGSLNLDKESSFMKDNTSYILRMWKSEDTIAILEMSENRLFLNCSNQFS